MNAIVCNYKVKGCCFWSKVNFSFMRLLTLFGRVMFLCVVNFRARLLNRVFLGRRNNSNDDCFHPPHLSTYDLSYDGIGAYECFINHT